MSGFGRVIRQIITAALLMAAWSRATRADNWPFWRGPDMNGVSREKSAPLAWSAAQNVRWKVALPGPGMSTPVIWGDRIFLTQSLDRAGARRALNCYARRDGKLLWQRITEFRGPPESTYNGEPHFCSASPATDGDRVVAFFASAGLHCFSLDGKPQWSKDLGRCEQIWGTASSPIIYKNLVILNFGPGARTFLIALDKRTGEEKWRVNVPGKFGADQKEWLGSWSTPVVAQDELLMAWPDELKAYDPQTGREKWTCRGLGRLAYTSPVVTADIVLQLSGFGGPALAVRRGGSGDVTGTHLLWREERSTQRIGSGVVVGDHFYFMNESGIAECRDLKTGRSVWKERVTSTAWTSLLCAGGRLYATSQRGETVVMAASPSFKVLARNPLDERTMATPALSNGDLFIRTYNHLWCISANGAPAAAVGAR